MRRYCELNTIIAVLSVCGLIRAVRASEMNLAVWYLRLPHFARQEQVRSLISD